MTFVEVYVKGKFDDTIKFSTAVRITSQNTAPKEARKVQLEFQLVPQEQSNGQLMQFIFTQRSQKTEIQRFCLGKNSDLLVLALT